MALQCQWLIHGKEEHDTTRGHEARAVEMRAAASNWRLLCQFDSDIDMGIEWGGGGRLYWCVEESAAAAGDFSNILVILQSYDG